jgi:hypothetical protein
VRLNIEAMRLYQGPVGDLAGSQGAVVEVRTSRTEALRTALAERDLERLLLDGCARH